MSKSNKKNGPQDVKPESIVLGENKFLRIGSLCVLARISIWGKEPPEYKYVLAFNNYPSCMTDGEYEVYGVGDDSITAILNGIKNFSESAAKGICIGSLKHISLRDLQERIEKVDGSIASPSETVFPIEHGEYTSNAHVCIEGEKAFTLLV